MFRNPCREAIFKFVGNYLTQSPTEFITSKDLTNIMTAFLHKKGCKLSNMFLNNALTHYGITKKRIRCNGKQITVYYAVVHPEVWNRYKNYITNKIQLVITNADKIDFGNIIYYHLHNRSKLVMEAVKLLQKLNYANKKRIRYNGFQITVYELDTMYLNDDNMF